MWLDRYRSAVDDAGTLPISVGPNQGFLSPSGSIFTMLPFLYSSGVGAVGAVQDGASRPPLAVQGCRFFHIVRNPARDGVLPLWDSGDCID
jgi:hypothetical protein